MVLDKAGYDDIEIIGDSEVRILIVRPNLTKLKRGKNEA